MFPHQAAGATGGSKVENGALAAAALHLPREFDRTSL